MKSYLIQLKAFIVKVEPRAGEKGELKNGTYSHDVIENKCRKNGHFSTCQDVYESKYVMR